VQIVRTINKSPSVEKLHWAKICRSRSGLPASVTIFYARVRINGPSGEQLMHLVLGFLGTVITILYLLDRLGIDLGGLNPFYWYRRRAFARKYGSDPIYSVEDPIHVAALLVIGAAKLDGDLTAEQKKTAQGLFESEFSLDSREASQLFGSAAHLLAAPQLIDTQLGKLADRNKDRFSQDQASSLAHMMVKVASADGDLTTAQSEFIEGVRTQFVREEKRQGTWSWFSD